MFARVVTAFRKCFSSAIVEFQEGGCKVTIQSGALFFFGGNCVKQFIGKVNTDGKYPF